MRWVRTVALAALALKGAAVVAWWSGGLAWAEQPAAPAGAEESGVAPDLLARSRGFREMLEAIRARGEELDRREAALVAREAALRSLQQTLDAQLGRADGAALANAAATGPCSVTVTKIYASMRPEEAAPIIDRLDDATAKAIFGCMRERQIGAILASMRPERAVALTRVLSGGA